MNRTSLLSMLLLLNLWIWSSCVKDRNEIGNNFVTSSEDLTTQQDILDANESEISSQIDLAFVQMTTRSFPTRTWANPKGSFPNTLTIDYGSSGVKDAYNRIRKGKLIITISAPIVSTGSVREVQHYNFYIDDVKVDGTVVLINQGQNNAGQHVFLRTVTGRKLLFPSGKTISWNATQRITQLEGNATSDMRLDDVWSILGSSAGINRNGNDFTVTSTKALIYKFTCPWITEGEIVLNVDGYSLSIDYGNGICNNTASITLPDGSTREVLIRRWW